MTRASSMFIWGTEEKSMLNLTDYAVSYGQSQIIQGLNLSIAPGEIVALVGRNGMG